MKVVEHAKKSDICLASDSVSRNTTDNRVFFFLLGA